MSSLICPLCSSESAFTTLECLQVSLLLAASKKLICPVCQDVIFGLDKLTIHLFQHQAFGKILPHHIAQSQTIQNETTIQNEPTRLTLLPFTLDTTTTISNKEGNSSLSAVPHQGHGVQSPTTGTLSRFSEVMTMTNNEQVKNVTDNEQNDDVIVQEDENTDNNKYQTHVSQVAIDNKNVHTNRENTKQQQEEGSACTFWLESDHPWHCPCCEVDLSASSQETVRYSPKCEKCQIVFNCIPFWNQHISSVHKGRNGIDGNDQCFVCKLCQESCPDVWSLHRHITQSHEDRPFLCHICYKTFKVKGSLRVHVRVVHGSARKKTRDKSLSDSDSITQSPSQQRSSKQWECEICKKLFTTKYFQKKHKRLHTGETPYCCELCGRTFTFQQSYHKHMLYHSDERPHACADCGKSFKELSTLNNHQRIHTGERPYICETCGKSFRQRVSYLVHRRIHTGVMPYTCMDCGKCFRYKVSQRTHKCTLQPNIIHRDSDFFRRILQQTTSVNNDQQSIDTATIPHRTWPTSNENNVNRDIEDLITDYGSDLTIDDLLSRPTPQSVTNGLNTINKESVRDLIFPANITF